MSIITFQLANLLAVLLFFIITIRIKSTYPWIDLAIDAIAIASVKISIVVITTITTTVHAECHYNFLKLMSVRVSLFCRWDELDEWIATENLQKLISNTIKEIQ